MEKITGYAGYRGSCTLPGTALALLLFAPGAVSQELATAERYASNYNSSVTSSDESLASNFDDRWNGSNPPTAEFVLGPNGVIAKETDHQVATSPNQIENNDGYPIAANASGYFPFDADEIAPTITSRATGALTNSSAIPSKSGGLNAASECGPSPLSPDEIKSLVVSTARRYGVDEGFAVAIAWAESRFDENRNSPKGARGPMQLIPETAARFGVQDICDPAQNIEGGIKYLRFLLDEFQNPLLVAAAYNSGEGRIYEYGGVPPFQETVGYVAKVVNFQLGLPMPSGKRKGSGVSHDVAAKNTSDAGVIAVEKTGKFVGGVMHF